PLASALRPSSVAAIFSRTQGRPRCTRDRKPRLSSRASSSSRPCSKRMPAAASASPPCAACGLGSRSAATTRATLASMSAPAHGGVRPWWLQGSKFTYAVHPSAPERIFSRATISACGPPARSCQPSATTVSPCVRTQPTRGLGVVVKRPFSASASARRIIAWSNAENTALALFPAAHARPLALLSSRRLDFLHRLAEIVRGLEAAVHRGEADIGDLVELGELADDEVAHPAGGHLALTERAQPLDHAVDRAFDLVGGDGALPQREHHASHELVAVEVGAAAVLLHQARHLEVDALIGGEALGALHALPAAAN